jgi:hypothetical protein
VAVGEEEEGERLLWLKPFCDDGGTSVTVHLRDGWIDTPLVPGDSVHLLAPLVPSPEGPRAVCDYKSGTTSLDCSSNLKSFETGATVSSSELFLLEEDFLIINP